MAPVQAGAAWRFKYLFFLQNHGLARQEHLAPGVSVTLC